MMNTEPKAVPATEQDAPVYCPICTHTVHVAVLAQGKRVKVKAGQKCPHCSASIDAGYVMRFDRAA
jgi:hypothetical protein